MTRVLTEVPANADFTTGLICPVNGEAGSGALANLLSLASASITLAPA